MYASKNPQAPSDVTQKNGIEVEGGYATNEALMQIALGLKGANELGNKQFEEEKKKNDKRFEEEKKKNERFANSVVGTLSGIDGRLTSVEGRMNNMEGIHAEQNHRIDAQDKRINTLEKRMKTIGKSVKKSLREEMKKLGQEEGTPFSFGSNDGSLGKSAYR